MRLLFKQRIFSWLDSYDIYYEDGSTDYTVEGRLGWGHNLEILDPGGRRVGALREKVMTFLPRFEMYMNDAYIGSICKEFTFFKPVFSLDCNGWEVRGDLWAWSYEVDDPAGNWIMRAEKELFNWTDTYVIDVADPRNGLLSLMIVLAIDAAKCSER